jgi:hypothetical protein
MRRAFGRSVGIFARGVTKSPKFYMRRTNFIYAIYIFGPERSILELFQLGLVGLAEKRSCPGSSWIGRGKRAPQGRKP